MVYYPVSYSLYFIMIGAAFVVAIVLVLLCRVLNNSLKSNTFSDKAVTFMDIPLAVIIVCVVIGFFAGMFIGNIQVDSSLTTISKVLRKCIKITSFSSDNRKQRQFKAAAFPKNAAAFL